MTENLNVFAVRTLTQKEYFAPGHRACQGCAEALAVRLVAKALGRNVIVASATGCMEIVSSPLPFTSWRVPWFHVAFENAAAVASGVESGLKVLMRKGRIPHKKIVTIAMAGDGGTADIGLQALSGALETRPRHDLYLHRQRSLYEHGNPAVLFHPLWCIDHHLSGRKGEDGADHLEEEYACHCRCS